MNNITADKADYTRFSFSLTKDSLDCIDMISGQSASVHDGKVLLNDIDASKVLMHLVDIQTIIARNPIIDHVILLPKKTANVNIVEQGPNSFEITYSKGSATYANGVFSASRKFDMKDIQYAIMNVFDEIKLLQEKGSGVGEYVIYDSVNNMLIIKNPAQDLRIFCELSHPGSRDNLLVGCIVNGKPYRFVALISDKLKGKVELITDTGEYIGDIPYTSSVLKVCSQLPGFNPDVPRMRISRHQKESDNN